MGPTLAIATGHELSLALVRGGHVLAERQEALVRGHAEALMPMVQDLLSGAPDRPSRLVVEIGPGSFTGLRVGIAAARALGLAWDVPVQGVRSTLLVAAALRRRLIALQQDHDMEVLIALAAPRGQIWVEPVMLDGLQGTAAPQAVLPDEALALAKGFRLVAGSAAPLLSAAAPIAEERAPRAAAIADIPAARLEAPAPLYVRTESRAA